MEGISPSISWEVCWVDVDRQEGGDVHRVLGQDVEACCDEYLPVARVERQLVEEIRPPGGDRSYWGNWGRCVAPTPRVSLQW